MTDSIDALEIISVYCMAAFAAQLAAQIMSLHMGQVFELHYVDGTIMFQRTGPGEFLVHHTDEDSDEIMQGNMTSNEVPRWAETISPYDVHGFGTDVDHDGDLVLPRLHLDMDEIPNGNTQALSTTRPCLSTRTLCISSGQQISGTTCT
jgi:hypothetical protein